MADQSLEQEGHGQHGARPTTGGVAWRGGGEWPGAEELGLTQQDDPRLALWVPGSYACLQDLYVPLGVCDGIKKSYPPAGMSRWLLIGAARVNEHLFNRGWAVPLLQWSATVVWANCELAYVGASRTRGVNLEGAQLANLAARERAVSDWLQAAQDREITPDSRLSKAQEGSSDFRYLAGPQRGWAQPPCYQAALGQFTRNSRF